MHHSPYWYLMFNHLVTIKKIIFCCKNNLTRFVVAIYDNGESKHLFETPIDSNATILEIDVHDTVESLDSRTLDD